MKYFFAVLLASVLVVPAANAVEVCCIQRGPGGEITACKDANPSFGHCQSDEGEEVEQSCERVPECRSRMVSCVCRLTYGDRNNAVRSCEVTSEPECQRLNQRNVASGVGTCGPEPVDVNLCRECNSSADRTGCIAGTEQRASQIPTIEYRSPQLGIPIPGLPVELSKIQLEGPEGGKFILIPWIAQYITAVVNFLLGIVLLIATVMVVAGGFMWLMAGGAPDKITDAKKRITNAVIGLTLALGTYLLLNLINPELTQFKALKIDFVKRETLEPFEETGGPVRIAGHPSNCPNPTNIVSIPNSEGLVGGGNQVHRAILPALQRAGAAAAALGCRLQINSGWRSLEMQQELWARSFAQVQRDNHGITEEEAIAIARKGTAIPDPQCGSPHMTGRTVDVVLFCGDSRNPYAGHGGCREQNDVPVEARAKLQDVMHGAGFVRYCAESWHFEIGTDRWERGRAAGAKCDSTWMCKTTEHRPRY